MDGFRLVKLNEVIRQVDIVITCTGMSVALHWELPADVARGGRSIAGLLQAELEEGQLPRSGGHLLLLLQRGCGSVL